MSRWDVTRYVAIRTAVLWLYGLVFFIAGFGACRLF